MATAGSIVVDLLMRTGAFETDTKRAEEMAKKRAKAIDEAFAKMGQAIGVSAGLAASALVLMVKNTAESASEITKLAQVANAPTQIFQQWAAASESVGIQQDKLADILKDVNDKVGEFLSTGGGPLKDFFEQIAPKVGITAEAFRNLSGPQALQLYVDSLEKAGANQQQMTFFMEALASDATALIPLLADGGKEFRRLGDEAQRTGNVLSDDALRAAKELDQQITQLQRNLRGMGNVLVSEILPVLTVLSKEANDSAEGFGALNAVSEVVATTLEAVSVLGVNVAYVLKQMGTEIGGIAAQLVALATLDFDGFSVIGEEMRKDAKAAREEVDRLSYAIVNARKLTSNAGLGRSGADYVDPRILGATPSSETVGAGLSVGTRLPTPGLKDKGDKGAEKVLNEYQRQMEAAAKMVREATGETEGLTKAQLALQDVMASDAWVKYTEAQRAALTTAYQEASATVALQESKKAMKSAREEETRAALDNIDALTKQIEQQQIENKYRGDAWKIIEQTAIARLKEKAAILESFGGGEEQVALINREIEARQKLLDLKVEDEDDYWGKWLASAEKSLTSFDELAGGVIDNFSSQFGGAFERMIFDSENLGDAVDQLAEGMLRSIVNALGQMAAQWLAYQAVQLIVGKTTAASAATSKALEAQAAVVMSGLNAFSSTAAIPVVGPLLAPGAAALAVAATTPMAATVAALSAAAAGARATGGPVSADTPYLVGERGAELFVPNTSGAIVPNDRLGGGNVTVNLIEDKRRAGTTERRANNGEQELDVFVADILGDGVRSRAIQQAFGLRRKGN